MLVRGWCRHVRGTECDQVIFSGGETRGTVTSPYYPAPYPLNVRCIYYLDGLHDKQNLEKVQLTITDLDIPGTSTAAGYRRRPPTAPQRCEPGAGYLQVIIIIIYFFILFF